MDGLSWRVIGAALEVHRRLGPGLSELVYQDALLWELHERGIKVEAEKPIPVRYKGTELKHGLRVDLLVEDELIVELKAVPKVEPIHLSQVLTYLRCAEKRIGLLINFGAPLLTDGVRRILNPRISK